MDLTGLIEGYKRFLYAFSEITAATLELVGIVIILLGTARALFRMVRNSRRPSAFNVRVGLGQSLVLALECKMGAEIIHTVIVRDLKELATLTVVILIRVLLAVIIHWEIRTESLSERSSADSSNTQKGSES